MRLSIAHTAPVAVLGKYAATSLASLVAGPGQINVTASARQFPKREARILRASALV